LDICQIGHPGTTVLIIPCGHRHAHGSDGYIISTQTLYCCKGLCNYEHTANFGNKVKDGKT